MGVNTLPCRFGFSSGTAHYESGGNWGGFGLRKAFANLALNWVLTAID
jgi:hypothetical protein